VNKPLDRLSREDEGGTRQEPPLCQTSCRLNRIGTFGGAESRKWLDKDRIVARLLPPESSSVEHVSRDVAISVATLERWRAEALANGSGAGRPRWTAAARLQAVIVTTAMDEATRSAWCREQGLYPAELDAWKRDADCRSRRAAGGQCH